MNEPTIQEQLAARKAAYWAQRAAPKDKTRPIAVMVCGTCCRAKGTFERRGERLIHTNCPGEDDKARKIKARMRSAAPPQPRPLTEVDMAKAMIEGTL